MANELRHYGVKGMKWGVRKSRESRNADKIAKAERTRKQPLAAKYSQEEYYKDVLRRGPKRANRINKIINKSGGRYAVSTARAMDTNISNSNRQMLGVGVATLGLGALFVGPILVELAGRGLQNAAASRAAARGAKAAADLLAGERGITSYETISLAFDAASKTWKF